MASVVEVVPAAVRTLGVVQLRCTWFTSAQCVMLVACDRTDEIFICSSFSLSLIVPTNATNSSGDILSSSAAQHASGGGAGE